MSPAAGLSLLALAGLLVTVHQAWQLRPLIAHSTLTSAWNWACAGLLLACLLAILRVIPNLLTLRSDSAAQYLVTTLLLVPLIDILGARRPGHRAWPWFVILPLIAVLNWPCVTQLVSGRPDRAVEIPTPTVIGWLFVLLMGSGNHFGTRNSLTALLVAAGLITWLLPVTEWVEFPGPGATAGGSWLLAAAAVLTRTRYHVFPIAADCPPAGQAGVQQLWLDFRDLYGLVWARRVADRVNQFAVRERWSVQLTLDGFQAVSDRFPAADTQQQDAGLPLSDASLKRPVQVLCWVLRRFLDREFLRRYLSETDLLPDQSGDAAGKLVS